jgi:hypothetical protein
MEISPEKLNIMAFFGQGPVRRKIILDNKCLQQVKKFKYLGCEISYENEKDIQQEAAKCAQILGILNNTFKPTPVRKSLRIKIYSALALPILLHGSEIWTLRQKDKERLTTTEMQFSKGTARYTLFDHKRDEEILEELTVEPVDEKLRRYNSNWLQHATRTNSSRMPNIMLSYRPNGRRRPGRPWKRLLDKAETGLLRPDDG